MSKQWVEEDAKIGELIKEFGVERYAEFDPIRRCVLYLGKIETSFAMQMNHKRWLDKNGGWYNEVIEIGGGVGIMAEIMSKSVSKVSIIDNPNINKVQEYTVPNVPHVDLNYTPLPDDTLVMSLFAMSELDYSERNAYWDKFRDCQWFFGFQEKHEGFDNLDWFVNRAVHSHRRFVMEPVPGFKGLWYLYIEARK